MSKYFLFIATIVTLPTNTWAMDSQIIIAKPSNIYTPQNYQHETTPRVSRRKPTPCHDAIDFNNLINEFGQASNKNDYDLQNKLFHQIDTMLKNENKLNGYHPALTLRNLKISSIYNGTPLQAPKRFQEYHIDPIDKDAYLRVCEYMTRNKPLHKHILSLIGIWFEQTPETNLPITSTDNDPKATPTHCQELIFNVLINKFDTKTHIKEIITYIKNKNYLHGYGPMAIIRDLSHGIITDESPFCSPKAWTDYQPAGINKEQYRKICLEIIAARARSTNQRDAQKFQNIYHYVEKITQ